MVELSRRVRIIDWKDGVLTLDEKEAVPLPEISRELMERIGARSSLVAFHVKGYPMTDELLRPLTGQKNMVNLGVEDGALTDQCFSILASMMKLRYLTLNGNRKITGSGLTDLVKGKIEMLMLNDTALDDSGLRQAADIAKLTHLHIRNTRVTYEGVMSVAYNNRLVLIAGESFTKAQMEEFAVAQRNQAKKHTAVDRQAADEAQAVLTAFFAAMTAWERETHKTGFEHPTVKPALQEIWAKYVSEKPRWGWRPLGLSLSPDGTYAVEKVIDVEQFSKNRLRLYTKQTGGAESERRFTMRRVGDGWKIDRVEERLNGWERVGL